MAIKVLDRDQAHVRASSIAQPSLDSATISCEHHLGHQLDRHTIDNDNLYSPRTSPLDTDYQSHHDTMSGLDPQGPSQPTLNQAYTTPGNPVSKDPSEQLQSEFNATDNSAAVDKRIPTKQASDGQGEANAKAPSGGIHGAPAGEEAKGKTEEDVGRHKELDGAQMAAPGEGRVAEAVAQGGKGLGGGGAEPDLASDLDR